MLRRTQINLSERQRHLLREDASKLGVPMSELIRRAIDEHYQQQIPVKERLRRIDAAAGVWKNRKDIGDSVEYVNKLRTPLRYTP